MSKHVTLIVSLASLIAVAGCGQVPLRDRTQKTTAGSHPIEESTLESQMSLARLSERHSQIDYAGQVYQTILRKHPEYAPAHHRMAVIHAQKQDAEAAEKHFRLALQHGERTPELLADIGYFFYLQENLGDAESMYRESLEARPNDKGTRNNLALVLGEQGRFDEAMAEFVKCVSEAEAHANMGYIYALIGDLPKAEFEYNTALSLDSSLRNAAEAMIQLEQRRRSEQAIAQAREQLPQKESGESAEGTEASSPVSLASATAPVEEEQPAPADQSQGRNKLGKPNQLIESMFDRPRQVADDQPQRRTRASKDVRAAVHHATEGVAPVVKPAEYKRQSSSKTTKAAAKSVSEQSAKASVSLSDQATSGSSDQPIVVGPLEGMKNSPRRNVTGGATMPWQQSTWSTQQ